MIAVDPADQRRGVGRALTEHATAWMRDAGMRVAALGTGGDPGHAPARALYERAGYRPLPGVQYFRTL
jgi:GNAT superfamily N-acetyltransferase